jgi:hypothetical protein
MQPGPTKRQKELKRQEKQREKERVREERKREKASRPPRGPNDPDPDIAGIVPGPQPRLDEDLPPQPAPSAPDEPR